jgi:hypothetical protein
MGSVLHKPHYSTQAICNELGVNYPTEWSDAYIDQDDDGSFFLFNPNFTDAELQAAVDKADHTLDHWILLRKQRGLLLAESDNKQRVLVDKFILGAGTQKAKAWATYRQALRDLPSTTVDPLNPIWPVIPK